MPFTVAHAAVAPPIGRAVGGTLPVVAVAAGAISPDLEHFVLGRIDRSIGHEPFGILLLDLPLALAFLLLWCALVVPGVIGLLPDRYRHLAGPIADQFRLGHAWRSPGGVGRIGLAIVVGASTHLIWDEFTHGPVRDIAPIDWLNSYPFMIGRAEFAAYSIVHWVSTAGGMAALMWSLDRWIERQPIGVEPPPAVSRLTRPGRFAAWLFLVVAVAGFAAQSPIAALESGVGRPAALGDRLATSTVWALTGGFAALAVLGGLIRLGLVGRRATVADVPRPRPRPTPPSVLAEHGQEHEYRYDYGPAER